MERKLLDSEGGLKTSQFRLTGLSLLLLDYNAITTEAFVCLFVVFFFWGGCCPVSCTVLRAISFTPLVQALIPRARPHQNTITILLRTAALSPQVHSIMRQIVRIDSFNTDQDTALLAIESLRQCPVVSVLIQHRQETPVLIQHRQETPVLIQHRQDIMYPAYAESEQASLGTAEVSRSVPMLYYSTYHALLLTTVLAKTRSETESHRQSDGHCNCFKGNVGKTSERRGSPQKTD